MKLYIYDRAGAINLTAIDFGYDNAYVLDYDFDSYGSGLNSFVVEYIADGELKQAGVLYEIQWNGKYQPLYYRELEFSYYTGRFETLYEITEMDVYGYSFESMVDDIVFAKSNHWYLVSGNDTIYGNSYGGLFDTGIGDDIIYGYGGNDLIWIGAGNDIAYGGTGNDAFYTTSASSNFGGINYAYGESGTDSLIISSSQAVFRSVDVWGDRGFAKGTEYLFVQDNNGGYLYATGIERIQILNGARDTVDNWNYYISNVVYRPGYNLSDKNYTSNNTNYTIDLGEYISTINYGDTTKYEFKLSDSSYNDQFTLSGDILKINNGSGSTKTVDVTITASTVSSSGIVRPGQSPAEKTFSVTFKDNNFSSNTPSGTSGDDTLTLTSGNDTWRVGKGKDVVDGGSGIDTIIVPDDFNFSFTQAKDNPYGTYTGIPFQNFLYLNLDGSDRTIALNFEKITTNGITSDISTFSDTGRYDVTNLTIANQTLASNTSRDISLSDYLYTINASASVTYSIKNIDNEALKDQITLSGSTLTLKSGSQGSNLTTEVTIRATQNFSDNWNFSDESYNWEENTFTVTMKDDDYVPETINYSLSANATSVDEGSKVSFTITVDKTSETEQTFSYSIEGDSNGETVDKALSSDIISSLTGTVKIPSSSTSVTFDINIASDSLNEGIEGFKLTIKNSEQAIIDSKIILINNVEPVVEGYQLSSSKNEYGPSLSEYSSLASSSGTLNLKSSDEIIVLTGQAGTLRGLEGNDTYLISDLITSNTKINITDTDGQNIIQIPDNTKITKVLFVSNAARLWLSNDQEITINSADKHTYNVSGNSAGGDLGNPYTYEEFVNLFGVDIGSGEQTVNLYTKSDEKSSSNYTIIDLSATADKTITATSDAEDFRYEVNSSGNSIEGPYTITINNFDKENDKLTLVNTDGSSSLTTQEFDELSGVDITSDELSGTQIFFAPDSSGQSGSLTISDLVETFSTAWEATTYTVEITPKANLASATSSGDLTYSFSDNLDTNKVVLTAFNTSTDSGTANYTTMSEILILTGQGTSIRGLAGDDTYILSNLIPENSKISIVDTDGDNVIQIPDNTYIDATLFTKNASRVTLSDGREITINSADKFTYNIGANVTTGDSSENLTFTEFASAFGIDDVLNLSGSSTGTISDQYII